MKLNEHILKFLDIHNKLKDAIENIDDGRDLNLTDIREIEKAMHYIRHTFGFKPPKENLYYCDYVLGKDAK